MRGATVLDAYSRLSNTTLGPYSQIILQFGSNDLDRRPEMVVLEYKLLLSAVRLNTKSTSKIFISAIPPRLDRRAEAAKCLNGYLSSLADPVANIFFLSHDSAFATAAVPQLIFWKATKVGSPPNFPKLMSQLWGIPQPQYFVTSLLEPHQTHFWKHYIYHQEDTKVGSQNLATKFCFVPDW